MNLADILETFCDEAAAIPVFQRNRCLRSRFSRSGCMHCIDSCPKGALSFDNGTVNVDERSCTGCLACTAVCPSGGLSWKGTEGFRETVAGMTGLSNPVLACDRHNQFGHDTVPCLGVLSNQHLLYLGVMGQGNFQLDGRHCGTCENGAVLGRVKKNLAALAEGLSVSMDSFCCLVTEDDDLRCGETFEDRRHFLGGLKRLMKTKGRTILVAEVGDSSESGDFRIRTKEPDNKTELLNHALDAVDGQLRQRIIRIFRHEACIDKECNSCSGCSAICPNGALKLLRGDSGEKLLRFETSACCGCGLCVAFCRRDALEIQSCGKNLTTEGLNHVEKNDGGLRCLDLEHLN